MAAGERVTEADIVLLNRGTVVRGAFFARTAGSVLIVIGAIGFLTWLWTVLRGQNVLGDLGEDFFVGGGDSLSISERIDVFSYSIGLLLESALVVGVGCALRLIADYTVARLGGSLTGYEVGDDVPPPVEAALNEATDPRS